MKYLIHILIFLFFFVASCASLIPVQPPAPGFSVAQAEEALSRRSSDLAMVHIYLPREQGGRTEFTIRANDVEIGILKKEGCLRFFANPGELEVTADVRVKILTTGILQAAISGKTSVRLNIEPKSHYYIMTRSFDFALDQELFMTAVPQSQGQNEIQFCKPCDVKAEAGMHYLSISPNWERVAYMTTANGKWLVIDDGIAGQPYDDIVKDSITFSPDGKRLAYMASADKKWFIVIDGKTEQPYDGLSYSITFSPDGKRLAYMATADKKWFVVVDGKAEQPYDSLAIGSLAFNTDGSIKYRAKTGGKWIDIDAQKQAD